MSSPERSCSGSTVFAGSTRYSLPPPPPPPPPPPRPPGETSHHTLSLATTRFDGLLEILLSLYIPVSQRPSQHLHSSNFHAR